MPAVRAFRRRFENVIRHAGTRSSDGIKNPIRLRLKSGACIPHSFNSFFGPSHHYSVRAAHNQRLRFPQASSTARPIPSSKRLEGSGTSPLSENAALNGPSWVMSVPIRSQSGERSPFRIQLCRSVKPGGNGVPGGTIGLGADSQRKFPLDNMTSGRKK